MLVISRSRSDRISFPSLGISIEILKVAGNRASVGIEAPREVRIVRDELLTDAESSQLSEKRDRSGSDRESRHALRNQINRAVLNLQLAGKLFQHGDTDQGLQTLAAGLSELNRLELNPDPADKLHRQGDPGPGPEFAFGQVDARVLLVDDDENERVLMASYLRRCGIDVVEAADGLQALYALSESPRPDAVLLDMRMPNLDGPRTVNRIRSSSLYPNLPVFAVTGESSETTDLSVGEQGVNGWFRKPVDIEEVVAAVKECRASA